MSIMIFALALFVASGTCICETLKITLDREIQDARRQAISAKDVGFAKLRRLATGDRASYFGFSDDAEVAKAYVDDQPEVIFVLSTERVARFAEAARNESQKDRLDRILKLLDLPGEVVFFVKFDGKPRATIITVRADTGWTLAGLGIAPPVTAHEPDSFSIEIPAFAISLAARAVNDELALTSLVNAPRFGLSVNARTEVTSLFNILSLAARAQMNRVR